MKAWYFACSHWEYFHGLRDSHLRSALYSIFDILPLAHRRQKWQARASRSEEGLRLDISYVFSCGWYLFRLYGTIMYHLYPLRVHRELTNGNSPLMRGAFPQRRWSEDPGGFSGDLLRFCLATSNHISSSQIVWFRSSDVYVQLSLIWSIAKKGHHDAQWSLTLKVLDRPATKWYKWSVIYPTTALWALSDTWKKWWHQHGLCMSLWILCHHQ